MLHIFYVNIGQLIKLEDLNLAAGSVSDLHTSLEMETGVPVSSQLLLVSGGVSMEPSHIVCNYGAGTDTNPIFLFSKQVIETTNPPNVIPTNRELNLQNILNKTTAHTKSLAALQLKTNAAQELAKHSQNLVEESEELARSQALQGKGWYAVMQNLDRSVRSFSSHFDKLKEVVGSIQENRSYYQTLLATYKQDLQILRQLPFFDCFNPNNSEILPGSSFVSPKGFTCLLDWIEAQDPNSSVGQLAEESQLALSQFHNNEEIKSLMMTSQEIIDCVDNDRMRKIKGLEERLRTLQNFLRGAQDILQSQVDRAKGLQQQSHRAITTNDTSILSDLFDIQQQQLTVMYNNCQQLVDIRDKFYMTKQELTSNLHQRLMWVKSIESELVTSHSKSILFIGLSKKVYKRFEILSQIHQAPQIYINCINEVLRRRDYSKQFITWSGDVANLATSVRDSELESRKGFLEGNGHHFILSLFPGMTDTPSSFATNTKARDETLPDLQVDSISEVMQKFPRDLAASINLKNDQVLYASTSNQMSTQENELVNQYRKQVDLLNEQLQNMNNEHEIERSSLVATISSHKKQNQELLAQKIELETSLADSNTRMTVATKHSDNLHSQLEGQTASIHGYEAKVNDLNEQLEIFRSEMEKTVKSNEQLTTQQDAIAQAYQVEKLRSEELESRLSVSEDCLKNVRLVFGQQTANEMLCSEVQRVVTENQSLKTSLEQVNMDVSLKEITGDELKRELNTLRDNLETIEQDRDLLLRNSLQERMEDSKELGLERAKFDRDLHTQRIKCERELEQQRIEIERQHTATMDNARRLHEGEIVELRSQLAELRDKRETERRTSWNHREVETIKKLAIASSPPGRDAGNYQVLLDNLVHDHKAELEAKDRTIRELLHTENEDKLIRQQLETRIRDISRDNVVTRTPGSPYRSETIISQQPCYEQSQATPFQALLPISHEDESNTINKVLDDYKSKLYSHIGVESAPLMAPTSMEGSYVSLGGNTGDFVSKLTDDMCKRITEAKDELTRELQTFQRDLGQTTSRYKLLESGYQKLKKKYKEEIELHKSREMQDSDTRVQSATSQDLSLEPFSLEFGPTSFCVLEDQTNNEMSSMFRRQVPIHLSPPMLIRPTTPRIQMLEQIPPLDDMERAALKDFKIGDIVIFFNDHLNNYIAISTKDLIYYMHDDCVSQYTDGQREVPRSYLIGKVTSAPECCKIVKISRKRHLPLGTVFYRIRVERYP